MFDARWMFVSLFCFFPTLRVLIDSDGRDHRFCGAWRGEAGGGAAPRDLGSPGLDNLVIPFALQYERTYICHRYHEGCRGHHRHYRHR